MIQVEGIFSGGGDISAPIIGKDFNWTGGAGTYQVLDDGDKNWRIKFLSSGTFTPLKNMVIDAFLVGGGGGGGADSPNVDAMSGGNSTAFGVTAAGGSGAYYNSADKLGKGGNGGSGGGGAFLTGTAAPSSDAGSGGSDGSNGAKAAMSNAGGTGQGSTTREFGEATGDLYSGGGGGGSNSRAPDRGGAGGEGGGGKGGYDLSTANAPTAGTPNTGGGGGGNNYDGCGGGGGYTRTEKSIVLAANTEHSIVVGAGGSGATCNKTKMNGCDGGSGIVIIRKHKEAAA